MVSVSFGVRAIQWTCCFALHNKAGFYCKAISIYAIIVQVSRDLYRMLTETWSNYVCFVYILHFLYVSYLVSINKKVSEKTEDSSLCTDHLE